LNCKFNDVQSGIATDRRELSEAKCRLAGVKIMTELGNRIQELRKQHKLSQVELAEKINVSKSQMIRYENKGVQPPADTINKLAEVLGTTVDYLINGNSDEKAKAALKNSELLQRFREVETLPEREKSVLLEIIGAYIRDFKTKQAYVG
jgi:transcriptional regulator with XRE-family HTH domain